MQTGMALLIKSSQRHPGSMIGSTDYFFFFFAAFFFAGTRFHLPSGFVFELAAHRTIRITGSAYSFVVNL